MTNFSKHIFFSFQTRPRIHFSLNTSSLKNQNLGCSTLAHFGELIGKRNKIFWPFSRALIIFRENFLKFFNLICRGPSSQHGSPATRSVSSEVSPLRSFRLENGLSQDKGRLFATPPAPRRRYLPSPKANRPSWVQRHLRRPQTVNVDDSTLSG